MKKAIFFDRDGTLNYGVPRYERVDSLDKVELIPGILPALKRAAELDYIAFLVTNQAGISEGLITLDEFDSINNRVLELIAPSGINILKTYLCPHGEQDNCDCRKPSPKLLRDAAEAFDIDLENSWMIGDRPSDVETGHNAGTRTILVRSGVPTVTSELATFTAGTLLEAIEYVAGHPNRD